MRQHGSTQLQVKVYYPFHDRINSTFRADLFVVVPQQISIKLDEHGRQALLNDTHSNTRFTVANMPLGTLADPDNPDNPVHRVSQKVLNPEKPGHVDAQRIAYELRTFCNLFTFQLKSLVRVIQEAVRDEVGRDDAVHAGKAMVRDVRQAMGAFRDLRRLLMDPSVPEEVRQNHILADEFLGSQTVRHLLGLTSIVAREPSLGKLQSQLEKLVQRELSYQEERGYSAVRSDTISPEDTRGA